MDSAQFFAQALDTARKNLLPGVSPRDAALYALAEAHSRLSQSAFFAMVDDLGGQSEIVDEIERRLRAEVCAEEIRTARGSAPQVAGDVAAHGQGILEFFTATLRHAPVLMKRLAATRPSPEEFAVAARCLEWMADHAQCFPEEWATGGDPTAVQVVDRLTAAKNDCHGDFVAEIAGR